MVSRAKVQDLGSMPRRAVTGGNHEIGRYVRLVGRLTGVSSRPERLARWRFRDRNRGAAELQDRGFPVWHPLPFEIPDDREGALHADEFLLGDEMLVAPFFDPGDKRSVYLPRGTWTNLETNDATTGPRIADRGFRDRHRVSASGWIYANA